MSDGPSLLHRFGGHGGRETEWEIHASRFDCPDTADTVAGLPKDVVTIQHSGMVSSGSADGTWPHEWIHLPVGITPVQAGAVIGHLAAGETDELVALLRRIDGRPAIVKSAKADFAVVVVHCGKCKHPEHRGQCGVVIGEAGPDSMFHPVCRCMR